MTEEKFELQNEEEVEAFYVWLDSNAEGVIEQYRDELTDLTKVPIEYQVKKWKESLKEE